MQFDRTWPRTCQACAFCALSAAAGWFVGCALVGRVGGRASGYAGWNLYAKLTLEYRPRPTSRNTRRRSELYFGRNQRKSASFAFAHRSHKKSFAFAQKTVAAVLKLGHSCTLLQDLKMSSAFELSAVV